MSSRAMIVSLRFSALSRSFSAASAWFSASRCSVSSSRAFSLFRYGGCEAMGHPTPKLVLRDVLVTPRDRNVICPQHFLERLEQLDCLVVIDFFWGHKPGHGGDSHAGCVELHDPDP